MRALICSLFIYLFVFICCASSQQLQTADVLTLKTEIKPDGTFFCLPPLHRVGFLGTCDSLCNDSKTPVVWLLRRRFPNCTHNLRCVLTVAMATDLRCYAEVTSVL